GGGVSRPDRGCPAHCDRAAPSDAHVGAALARAARPRAASESPQHADSAPTGNRLFGQQGVSGLAGQMASARRPPLWLAAAAVGCGWAALYNTASWIPTDGGGSP